MSRPAHLPFRVAVVQMHAHLAFEDDGKVYLGEPLGKPLDRPLLGRLDDHLSPGSPPQRHLEQLRKHIARAYDLSLRDRLASVLAFCAAHQANLVVFPEYSIPGTLIPTLVDEADRHQLAVVAGTHLVTTDLLDRALYADAFDILPDPGQAIAPVIIPGKKVFFQPKLFPSRWETSLVQGEGPILFRWEEKEITFGVPICIDFLRHRDAEGAVAHQTWRDKTDLLVVPSATPKDSAEQFANSGDHFFRSTHTPVVYVNLAEDGGTGIFGYGRPDGRPLAPGSAIVPLTRGHEGVIIVDLDLGDTVSSIPRRYDADTPIRLVAYALILHPESHPALNQVARQLGAASSVAEFKRLCRDHEHILTTAAREFRDIPWVKARWTALAKSAQGINNLADLRLRASDLWLPDHVHSISQTEQALSKATIQALRSIAAEPTSAADDRVKIQEAVDAYEKATRVGSIPPTPDPPPPTLRALLEEVLRFRTPDAPPPPTVAINPDGTLDPWVANPGPPPAQLVALGFELAARSTLGDGGLRFDLEPAATWLALQNAPPAWVGVSPNGTPALVIAPGHIVFVAHVIPPDVDLDLARANVGKPLPIALLTGDADGLAVSLPPDVIPLNHAIRQLALDRDHLRNLADYEYSPERSAFVEPKCRFGPSESAHILPGLTALTRWLHSPSPSAVLAGAVGDGRTTFLRTWLIGVARDALLRNGLPVRYIDATHWRAHDHVSELLASLTSKQLAALRLAVATGNLLLVVDGIDDIFPNLLTGHAFFRRWLSQGGVRTLQASPWTQSGDTIIRLLPTSDREPWITRSFLRAGTTREQLDHPTYAQLAGLMERLNRALLATVSDHQPKTPFPLEDLAHAIWSRPTATRQSIASIHEAEFRRARFRRQGSTSSDTDTPRIDVGLPFINAVDFPRSPAETPLWRWHTVHRALACSYSAPSERTYSSDRWLSIPWDALLVFLLARRTVEDLARGDASVLGMTPLYCDTVDYCIKHPSWPQAAKTVLSILAVPPSSPAASVNALLLAVADESLASSEETPWHLEGLDLRSLPLAASRLEHAHLQGTRLDYSILTSARLHGANLSDASFEGCDLSGADMSRVKASGARFTGVRLDDTSFVRAILHRADFSRSVVRTNPPVFDGAELGDVVAHATDWPNLPTELAQRATWSAPSAVPDQIDEIVPTPLYLDDGSLAWSRDDHTIATGDHHGRLWLWSGGPVRALAVLAAHHGVIRAIAFSPDRRLIATAGDDARVCLWSTSDLSAQGTLPHEYPVTGISWEDATTLWTFSGTPRRWSIASGIQLLETVTAISDAYEGALTGDGLHLITVERGPSQSKGFSVYRREDHTLLHQIPSQSARLPSLNLSRDLVACDTGKVIAVERTLDPGTVTDKVTDTHRLINNGFPKDTWSSDGGTLATIHDPPEFGLWSERSHTFAPTRGTASAGVLSLLFSNRDDRLLLLHGSFIVIATPSTNGFDAHSHARRFFCHYAVMHWDAVGIFLYNNKHRVEVNLTSAVVAHQQLTPPAHTAASEPHLNREGARYLVLDAIGPAIWHGVEQRPHYLDPAPLPSGAQATGGRDVMWSRDGELIATQQVYSMARGNLTEQRVSICLWGTESGKILWSDTLSHRGHLVIVQDGVPHSLAGRSFGNYIHFVDPDRSRRVTVQVDTQTAVYISGGCECIALRFPDGLLQMVSATTFLNLLSGLPEHTHETVTIREGQQLWAERFNPYFSGVAFSGAHERVAVIMAGSIAVRGARDGTHLGVLHTTMGAQTNTTFSPDGRHLACYFTGELQIWNIERSMCIARLVLLRNTDDQTLAGAIAISGPKFQRLAVEDTGTSPSLEGLYARSGVHLYPLDGLGQLESKTLTSTLIPPTPNE